MKIYLQLTKPGIIMGNLITAAGGFALASKGDINPWLFLAMLFGLGAVIGSACVFNNYLDRTLDSKMERTKNRALVNGLITPSKALLFGTLLGSFGIATLFLSTNAIAAGVAALGFFIYVAVYSLWKPHSMHAALVGSIAGAVPPVVGYAAVSHTLDLGALLLFGVLIFWQMPHFFAIAMVRQSDYAAASIPVLPNLRGLFATKVQMFFYVVAFSAVTLTLAAFGYVGIFYTTVTSILCAAWLYLSLKGFKAQDDQVWAKAMFRLSLVIITAFSVMISIDAL